MDKRYLTVVFEYEDGAVLPKELTEAFASKTGIYEDTRVVSVSMEDEITRAENLENQLDFFS